jgi:GTP-dependent phosphoenolpyruvate carboxykinase
VDHPQSGKKENKNDLKGKKKGGDSKQDTDAAIVNEEVKQYVYQWKSITADGQVFVQNSTNQEYEKIDQLRLILETNPKTNEVV